MATVCGTSLALMDAGVPIKEPVAGIAMGLIKEGDDFTVLSDILGDEDHLGDMDFKVAGTKDGITSLQMDIKITGITFEIMEQALNQAKDGRIHILGEMNKALSKSRDNVGKHTPKMEKITVDKKDIAAVIGKGGATIREIVEKSGAKVDVNDEGDVTVAAPDEVKLIAPDCGDPPGAVIVVMVLLSNTCPLRVRTSPDLSMNRDTAFDPLGTEDGEPTPSVISSLTPAPKLPLEVNLINFSEALPPS